MDDTLNSREVTKVITETSIRYNGMHLKIIDVGGQKSLRRKWLQLFESATAIIFVVSLIGYYQLMEEVPDMVI